jgi:hypothetical protein
MRRAIEIAGHTVDSGTRRVLRLPVTRRASGDDLHIAVHVVNGSEEGPVVGLASTSHGDEAFAIETIRRALAMLDPARLRGAVVAVPVLNPVAFESFTRTTGQGMNTDKNNMNRVFPGDARGWITEQMADVTSRHVVPLVSHLIDFHCGGLDTAIDYTLVEVRDDDTEGKTLALSRVFGSEILYTHKGGLYGGTLTDYARSKGVTCIVPEIGGSSLGEAHQKKAVQGVRNVLAHLKMIDGTVVRPKEQRIISRRTLLRPRNGGLFFPEVGYEALGATVKGGTVLGRVVDPHTLEEIEAIGAPYEASVMIMMRGILSRVNPGDYGYIVGDGSSAQPALN